MTLHWVNKHKRFILLILISTVGSKTIDAQNIDSVKSIKFIAEDFRAAMAQGAKKNKIVFIDAYTTWCGPCKLMDKSVFTDEKVLDFMNENFVNLKLDMERGDGQIVAQRYKVSAFPSFLFVNTEGELVHKGIGYQDADKFLSLASVALSANQGLLAWSRKFENGERSPDFLKNYALQLADVQDAKRADIAKLYVKSQPNWKNNNETLDFIFKFIETPDDTFFTLLSKNKTIFERRVSREAIELKRKNLIEEQLFDKKKLPTLARADSLLALVTDNKRALDSTERNYRMTYYRMKGDRNAYAQAAVNYFKKYDRNAGELAETANTFLDQIDAKTFLEKALKWAKRATRLEKISYHQFLVAQLYNKLKDKSAALKTADSAIALAKKAGESTDEISAFKARLMKE